MWLNMTLHFGLRGRQEHTSMLWGDLQLSTDAKGQEFVEFNERATKTRQGASRDSRPFHPKMYATGRFSFDFIAYHLLSSLRLLIFNVKYTNNIA